MQQSQTAQQQQGLSLGNSNANNNQPPSINVTTNSSNQQTSNVPQPTAQQFNIPPQQLTPQFLHSSSPGISAGIPTITLNVAALTSTPVLSLQKCFLFV